MRRFLITGTRYTGEAELLYNNDEVISCVDVRSTNMTPGQRKHFMNGVPVFINQLAESFEKKLNIVEADFLVSFDMFWRKYNMKRNKKAAEMLWEKLSKTKQIKAFTRIDVYDKYCTKNTWYNKMYPDTYIRGEHWEDEWEKL